MCDATLCNFCRGCGGHRHILVAQDHALGHRTSCRALVALSATMVQRRLSSSSVTAACFTFCLRGQQPAAWMPTARPPGQVRIRQAQPRQPPAWQALSPRAHRSRKRACAALPPVAHHRRSDACVLLVRPASGAALCRGGPPRRERGGGLAPVARSCVAARAARRRRRARHVSVHVGVLAARRLQRRQGLAGRPHARAQRPLRRRWRHRARLRALH